jgi:Uma2 family endonuclease
LSKGLSRGWGPPPDHLAIICGEPEFAKSKPNSLTNLKVIIEVLSPKTELYDRSTKFEHYKKIPTLQEYILIAQNKAFVESYIRQSDQKWLYQSFHGLVIEFQLATVPASVKMADIYAGVKFPESTGALRIAYEDQVHPDA